MISSAINDPCRIVLTAPSGAVEVAVPADVPLADLLPTLLHQAGDNLAEQGLDHGGWILQRLGEAPLDEDKTPTALGLRDGETIYLRPRQDQLPSIDFDDLIDGVSAGVRQRPDRWTPTMTRRALLGTMVVILGTGVGVLLIDGSTSVRAAAAGLLSAALVLGAAIASRALGDRAAGLILAYASVLYATLAGLLAPGGPPDELVVSGTHLLAGAVAGVAAALLALLAVGPALPVFGAAAVVGAAAGLGGLIPALAGTSAAQAAAVVLVLTLGLSTAIPVLSFRLAQLRLPLLPADSEELQEDIEPLPADTVLRSAKAADSFMNALFVAVGVVSVGALTMLAPAPGWAPPTLAATVCASLLLRARALVGGRQRLAAILPALYGLALVAVHLAAESDLLARLFGLLGLMVAAGLLLAAAQSLPGRRLAPYWGRAGDLAESLAAVALLPLTLAVLDAFSWARALAG